MNNIPGKRVAKLKHSSPKALNTASSKEFGCAKKAEYKGFTPLLVNNTCCPRGGFVRQSWPCPAGTDGGIREKAAWMCWGWADVGLRAGFNPQLFLGRKFVSLELIIGTHFSLALLSRRKAAVKHSGVCYLWGNFTEGGGRTEG